jgi:hypothetical protein
MLNNNFEKFGENIFVYKNFLSKEEISSILNSVQKFDDSEWSETGGSHVVSPWIETIEFVSDRIKENIPEPLEPHGRVACVVRMKKGGYWGEHVDNYDHEGVVDKADLYVEGMDYEEKKITEYGIIIYLNNDFVGGELYYPNQDLVYTPNPGDLVIHAAKEECRHGVKEITDGVRYTITSSVYKTVRVPKENG